VDSYGARAVRTLYESERFWYSSLYGDRIVSHAVRRLEPNVLPNHLENGLRPSENLFHVVG
jgi:hypothetical protein